MMRFMSRENKFKKLMSEEILFTNNYRFTCTEYEDNTANYLFDVLDNDEKTLASVNFCCDGDWITAITIKHCKETCDSKFWHLIHKLELSLSKKYPIFENSKKWGVEYFDLSKLFVYSPQGRKYWDNWLDLEELYRYDDPNWK